MKLLKSYKIIILQSLILSGTALAAPGDFNGFRDIGSIDELMALPQEELCSNGGPSRNEIHQILINEPLTLSMYQNDPNAARMLINEQSQNINAKIKQKCSTKENVSTRKLTRAMLRNEEEMCKAGAPTKEELKVLIKESNEIDEQLRAMPYEGRLLMEEAAKLNGTTLREMFIDDVTNAAAKNWQKACSEKSYIKKSEKKSTQERKDNNPSSNIKNEDNSDVSQKAYNISDQKLNDTWNKLNKDIRKKLLPSQREWIKSKSICNGNWVCLTDMTNKRIFELEAENAS